MNYSKYRSLAEFLEDNNIKNMLVESKKCNKGEQQEEEVEAGEENNPEGKPVKSDNLEVIYSDHDTELQNIFKHIIVFTNNDDPKNNKTLKNIYDAIEKKM